VYNQKFRKKKRKEWEAVDPDPEDSFSTITPPTITPP
jgi:hypothetical protein